MKEKRGCWRDPDIDKFRIYEEVVVRGPYERLEPADWLSLWERLEFYLARQICRLPGVWGGTSRWDTLYMGWSKSHLRIYQAGMFDQTIEYWRPIIKRPKRLHS